MKVNWIYNYKIQTVNYVFILTNIYKNFYQDLRFYLLPYLPEKFRSRTIYLPEIQLVYPLLRRIVKENIGKDSIMKYNMPANLISEIKKLFRLSSSNYKPQIELLTNQWNQIKEETIHTISDYFKNDLKEFEITIAPKILGSSGSFTYDRNNIFIFPRIDQKVKQIPRLIFKSLLRNKHFNKYNKIHDSIVLSNGAFHEIDEKFVSIYNKLNENTKSKPAKVLKTVLKKNYVGNLATISSDYYRKLGFPIRSLLNSSNQIQSLTEKENQIMDLLIEGRNKLITFDQIADVIWKENIREKYSLYAISKHIENCRRKIEKSGIKQNLIHTQRGKGYVLFD